jgi:hypothetical protein
MSIRYANETAASILCLHDVRCDVNALTDAPDSMRDGYDTVDGESMSTLS